MEVTGPGALLLTAVRKRYEADIQEAKATLAVYVTNSAGIGEHPQHCEEIDKLLAKMADASDKLELLETTFAYE